MANFENILHLPTEESLNTALGEIATAIKNDGGGSITVDTEMSDSSTNAVQNKVIKEYVDEQIGYSPFIVTMTYSNNALTGNKTFAEIKAAVDNGRIVIIKFDIPMVGSEVMFVGDVFYSYSREEYLVHCLNSNGTITGVNGSANDYPVVQIGG